MARGRKRKFEGSFGEFKKQQGLPPANRNISPSSAGSGYQAGADPGRGEISNYSPKDQKKIYDFAGGRDKFQEAASGIMQKYPRGADIDKYLDRINLYNKGIMYGGNESTDDTGLTRLNLNKTGLKNDAGNTILSLTRPELTAVPPTLSEFLGDIARGGGDMLGAVAENAMSGGIYGKLLNYAKDKFEGGKQKLNRFMNPPGEELKQNLDGILENVGASNSNPLFNEMTFDPIKVSDMDPSNMLADNTGVQGIYDRIKQLQDFGSKYGLDGIQVDPFNLNKGIGYENQFMFNDMPIDYGINIAPGGNFGFNLGLQY
jgi:hypothetical protein